MPMPENSRIGAVENPVIRSKFSRIRLNSEYFDLPAPRSSCATRISVGFIEKV